MLLLLINHFSHVWLCDPMDCSPPGSCVPGILQARILEWVAISFSTAYMHAKLLQSCLTLCGPMDSSLPGSSVHGVLQARMLEWIAISFSKFIWVSSKHHYLSPFRCDNWVWWPCTLILHLRLSSNFLLLLHLFMSLEIEKQFPQQVLECPPESRRNSQFVNNEVRRGVWWWDGSSEPSPSLQNCEK